MVKRQTRGFYLVCARVARTKKLWEFIRDLTESAKSGEAYVHLSGWSGQSQKDGTPYVYLSLEGKKFQAKGGGNFKSFNSPSKSGGASRQPAEEASPKDASGTIDIMSMLD